MIEVISSMSTCKAKLYRACSVDLIPIKFEGIGLRPWLDENRNRKSIELCDVFAGGTITESFDFHPVRCSFLATFSTQETQEMMKSIIQT
jgi:hypothetical protein